MNTFSFSQTQRDYSQARSHFKLELSDKKVIEYTIISKNDLSDKIRHSTRIVLLNLSSYGKIVYNEKTKFKEKPKWEGLLAVPAESEFTISLLPSNETLKVTYKYGHKDFEIIEYEIANLNTGKKIMILYEQVPISPSSFIPFLYDNFSNEFISSLEMLKNIIFKCWSLETDFPISPFIFRSLWGSTPETELKASEKKKEKVNQPLLQEFDCDFDAKFGYPCSPEEVPSKNPKVLVIEKKQ